MQARVAAVLVLLASACTRTVYVQAPPQGQSQQTDAYGNPVGPAASPAPGTPAGAPAAASSAKRYRIVDNGEVYSTINQTDCLSWPSPEIKRVAGENAWGRYKPSNGDEGDLVGQSRHCADYTIVVYILKVGDHYVPIGSTGVADLGLPPQIGKRYRIIDVGNIYDLINQTDCLQWPSDEMRRLGGSSGWDSYYPANGEIGTLVHVTRHCDTRESILVLQIGPYYVPLKQTAAEQVP